MCLIWGVGYALFGDVEDYRIYTGRMFLEADGYSDFKRYLGEHKEVDIKQLDVLSSPDALIDFKVKTPAGVGFPYGDCEIVMVFSVPWGTTAALSLILAIYLFALHHSGVI
jgi:hypothetical protein